MRKLSDEDLANYFVDRPEPSERAVSRGAAVADTALDDAFANPKLGRKDLPPEMKPRRGASSLPELMPDESLTWTGRDSGNDAPRMLGRLPVLLVAGLGLVGLVLMVSANGGTDLIADLPQIGR